MFDWLLVGVAAVFAGMINSVVGSGTLITFPTLLLLGYPPLTANISNNLGLIPGAVTAALGTRHRIEHRKLLRRLLPWSLIGALVGAFALVELPAKVFAVVIPFFIAGGVLLVLIAPRLTKEGAKQRVPHGFVVVLIGLAGVYGGYFGAAQGVLLIGLLTGLSALHIHEANAIKNIAVALVNTCAGVVFILTEHVNWTIAGVVALGSTFGALLGSRHGHRIPVNVYRFLVVVVGLLSILWLVLR